MWPYVTDDIFFNLINYILNNCNWYEGFYLNKMTSSVSCSSCNWVWQNYMSKCTIHSAHFAVGNVINLSPNLWCRVWKTYISISKSNLAWNFEVVHEIQLGKKNMKKSLLHETWSKTKCYFRSESHFYSPTKCKWLTVVPLTPKKKSPPLFSLTREQHAEASSPSQHLTDIFLRNFWVHSLMNCWYVAQLEANILEKIICFAGVFTWVCSETFVPFEEFGTVFLM